MAAPRTVFDKPQAALLPDPAGARDYANISNIVDFADGGRTWAVCVAVPTELFTFMKEVAKIPPEDAVTLSIDRVDPDWYVFSLLRGEDLYDLWHYSNMSLPAWLLDREYRHIPG